MKSNRFAAAPAWLVTVIVGCAGGVAIQTAAQPTASAADASTEGSWSSAKVGTLIRYRVTQAAVLPGAKPKIAVITEEVVSATADTVTVKIVSTSPGEADRISEATRPRRITAAQFDQFRKNMGSEGWFVDYKVGGQTFKCTTYKRFLRSPVGKADRDVEVQSIFCRDMPGWIAKQQASSVSWDDDEERYQMLEVRR